jgi:hypothetical protein
MHFQSLFFNTISILYLGCFNEKILISVKVTTLRKLFSNYRLQKRKGDFVLQAI